MNLKKMKKILLSAMILVMASAVLDAQSKTGYFVRNSTRGHYYNAAFAPDQGYVGIPVLSGINISLGANYGPSTFLFPLSNGKYGLFLNEEVDSDVFLSGLKDYSFTNLDFGYTVLDAGWYTGKDSFWTVSMGVDVNMDSSLPKELFRFLKNGMETDPQSYSIQNVAFGASAYSYVSLGYSRGLDDYVKGLRIGGKVKLLAAVSDIQANIERLDLNMSSQSWNVKTLGSAHVLGGGLVPAFDENGYVNGMSFDPSGLGVSGFGMAFDLGAEYTISEGTPVDGLRFSVSVTDLGFVSYGKNKSRVFTTEGEFTFEGFENMGEEGSDLNTQVDEVTNELIGLTHFEEQEVDKAQGGSLAATLHAGVDYSFLDDKMNVGLLYSARFGRFLTENELTLAWNYSPVRSFNIALSYSLFKTHSTFGWLLTFVPTKGVGIFLGSDYTSLNYTALAFDGFKIPVPSRNMVVDVNFGLTISLGGKNSRY